ncbi:MAG: hypothetical protein OXC92_09590 [Flavobacteriaceae bacterium]|nr:hypothetical protein [Flavobacteriaceae bacterium]MCY4217221.1 hypothetical protein [Flavobacteriaceae bacterium]MCY4253194.1 hypothetical protein [Flavobacteriaceae bacterium]
MADGTRFSSDEIRIEVSSHVSLETLRNQSSLGDWLNDFCIDVDYAALNPLEIKRTLFR